MQATLKAMETGPKPIREALNGILNILDEKIYDSYLVRHFLWGKKNNLVKLARDTLINQPNRPESENFGIYEGVSSIY